jgi:hypothetical protein
MARTVDIRWIDTYLNAKKAFEQQGQNATLASVAKALGMNQKTLNRIVAAGRYLERCLPAIEQTQVRCSYVHMELLEKISRISAHLADELLAPALVNQISISELSQQLDGLRSQSPLLAHALNSRAEKRRTAKGLVRDLFSFFEHTPLEFFEARNGAVLKAATSSIFQAPNAVLLDQHGNPQAVIFCKVGGDSRPASGVAIDLYELAVARRQMARKVWMVFPERSDVFMHLAELALWLGGSPLHNNTGWLRLAYFHDFGEKLVLNVLFEDACTELLKEVTAGNRRFEPEQLTWAGSQRDKPHEVTTVSIGYSPELPKAGAHRSYSEYLIETADEQTPYLKRLQAEHDLGI